MTDYSKPYHVYVAACTEQGGIYHYRMQGQKLSLEEITPMDRPMYMVAEAGKMYIVLREVFSDGSSGVITYDIGEGGKLQNPSEIQSTGGRVGCHILAEEGTVYCANYSSGSLIRLPDTLVVHQGQGTDPDRQEQPHVHFVGLTPDKKYICAADLGLDTVFVYHPDLTLHSSARVPDGQGVRHLAFSQDGKWMFAVNELGSTVSVFSYEDGRLELRDTCSCLPEGYTGISWAAAIRIREDRIYVSNRGHDSVACLSFEDGKLSFCGAVACGGRTPRDFLFADEVLLCANQDSDSLTLIDMREPETVRVCLEIPQPLCIAVIEA